MHWQLAGWLTGWNEQVQEEFGLSEDRELKENFRSYGWLPVGRLSYRLECAGAERYNV